MMLLKKTLYVAYVTVVVIVATTIMHRYDRDDRSSSIRSRSSWSDGSPRSK